MSTLDTKLCKKCGVEQHLSCFSKDKTHADGLASTCKTCRAAYQTKYYEEHKEELNAKSSAYSTVWNKTERGKESKKASYMRHRDQRLASNKTHYEKNKARILARCRQYYHENDIKTKRRERKKEYDKRYRTVNREKITARQAAYVAKRKKEDIVFKIRRNLSSRIHSVLKSPNKYTTTAMLGCAKTELMNHLESMFDGDMTWENYGLGGWEVDHIKPLAKFDLTDEEQLKQACHYTNLQPLWAFDNRSKGAKYEETSNG